jgi:thioredoxin-like negative regulator of GroEL
MSLNPNNINELKKSFDHLVQRNYEVQGDVKAALESEDYLIAVNIISNYVKMVDEFTKITLNMAQNYKEKADDENASACSKIVKMAEHIKTAHLEVEKNILKKYIKKEQKNET